MKKFICIVAGGLFVSSALADPPQPKFEPQTIDPAISIGYGLAIGDVDGDGKPDVLLADAKQIVWYHNPDWKKSVMAENLTERDNVCIAARDINGDGKVEVAVGAQWNPGETSDRDKSGAIFYLIRPEDPTQKWQSVRIEPHDPTTHRMHWVNIGDRYVLVVLPLHGVGNKGGEGKPVRLEVLTPPADLSDPTAQWSSAFYDTASHMTHNFDVVHPPAGPEAIFVAGKEGLSPGAMENGGFALDHLPGMSDAAGEVRLSLTPGWAVLATIEPMHGNRVAVQAGPDNAASPPPRRVLDETLAEGHALAAADLLGMKVPQVIVGWRNPNADDKVGIRMYIPDENAGKWTPFTIDDNTMACEDLKVADLDGDGKTDIIAAGRGTKNVVIYWNKTAMQKP
ncbi:MAG: hypothetical protein GC162_02050 [Planctomycetes bacterium]|nr:hypothetical protein [Planctomycetota bacterium]